MGDSSRIRGDTGVPLGPEPSREEENIDPEKFKKVLKVDESDESQKRHKRRLKKAEEEGEEEGEENVEAPPPGTKDFAGLMEDKEKPASLFDAKSGGIRRRSPTLSDSPYKPPPSSAMEEDEEPPEESPSLSEDFGDSDSSSLSEEGFISTPEESAEENPSSFFSTDEEEPLPPIDDLEATTDYPSMEGELLSSSYSEEQSSSPPKEEKKKEDVSPIEEKKEPEMTPQNKSEESKKAKKKEVDSSLLTTQAKKEALSSKKKDQKPTPTWVEEGVKEEGQAEKSSPEKKKKETGDMVTAAYSTAAEQATSGIIEQVGEEEIKSNLLKEKKREPTTFTRLNALEVRKKRIQALPSGLEKEPNANKKDQQQEGGKTVPFIEADATTAGIPLPEEVPTLPSVERANPPSYTKLSPEIHELFEKIGGVMLVQQNAGITKTTVVINMPNTVFNGAEVILDHYSSAPNSFNIQLVGSPEAVTIFTQNIDKLSEAFKDSQYNFETNILPPILQTQGKPPLIRRKGGAAGGDSNNQEDGSGEREGNK